VAALAAAALRDELATWPKPGLVSHIDAGSHGDMTARTFLASVEAIEPFFAELAFAGAAGSGMAELRAIGLEAEAAMLVATRGVNTHRGALFALGLLCAAGGAGARGAAGFCETVQRRWGQEIARGPIALHSHWTAALLAYGAGGARAQAAAGFPDARRIGIPALRSGRTLAERDPEAARVQTFFALLARVEDTNLLYRGGMRGLVYARTCALEFLDAGGVEQPHWRRAAGEIHRAFIARRLSPGGCADLLAVTLFLDALRTDQ
jgi:triphosphoribosyl-dephospho-CoA synthase